jgi:hypothetical protein
MRAWAKVLLKWGPDRVLCLLILLVLPSCFAVASSASSPASSASPPASSASPLAAASLELYGTFHALGVTFSVDAGDDPDQNSVASVWYHVAGSAEPYRQGYPLTRISGTRFVGSLFWLEPGTTYDVRVTCSDPDGGPLDGAIVEGTASTRNEITIPAPSYSLYVSPVGSGTVCSLNAPCSLQKGLSRARPGDEVVLRGGVYYQGDISLPQSGAPGAPIVIRGYEGETAVLDGADPETFAWTAQDGGIYRTTVHAANPHLVTADGERLYPYQSLADLQNLKWDTPGLYAEGTTLYVHLAADADPNRATMVVSRYNRAFVVEQDFIYFLNLTFRYYGQENWGRAIFFNSASDNLVQGCTFAINDTGLVMEGTSQRNVIQDNEFYDTIFGWRWDAVKDGSRLERGGLRFGKPAVVRGLVIRRNVFHDFFDGFDACPAESDDRTQEIDVYGNLVYNAGDDGMETDGQSSNVRIWGNTFHDVQSGISFAPARTGPVYVIRNLIYRSNAGNSDYDGKILKFNTASGDPSGYIYLFHNTADAVLAGPHGLHLSTTGGGWQLITSRNNVWASTELALRNQVPDLPVDLDYDDLWNGKKDHLLRWGDAYYDALADLTAATGQERHGLNAEPGFANVGISDYTLGPSSSLIDTGVVIPGINDDYVGAAPDIGAFEYRDVGSAVTTGSPSSMARVRNARDCLQVAPAGPMLCP